MRTPPRNGTRTRRCVNPMTAAASWTVGPSRPTEAPPSTAPIVSTALAATVRVEISVLVASFGLACAAITWGIPDPRANGT